MRAYCLNKVREEEVTKRYPEGAKVTVYYNPHQPEQAVLEPGLSERVCQIYYGVLVFCSVLFIVGLVLAAGLIVHILFVSAICIFAVSGYGFWFNDWASKYHEQAKRNWLTSWAASEGRDAFRSYARVITVIGLLLLIMIYVLVLT
jgi:hypothetical protein